MSMTRADLCKPHTEIGSSGNAITEILGFTLISINDETGLISLHRLTQVAFFDRVWKHERERTFKVAFSLLRKAFPGRQGHHHLWTRWQTCEQLTQHVLTFQAQYEILRKDGFSEQDEKLTWLICDTAWQVTVPPWAFLLGLLFGVCFLELTLSAGICSKSSHFLAANTHFFLLWITLKIGPLWRMPPYALTSLVSMRGQDVVSRQFHARRTLKIRKSKTKDKNDLANAFSDVGYSLTAAYQTEEGLKYLEKALAIAEAA